jgi:hypothetical protein
MSTFFENPKESASYFELGCGIIFSVQFLRCAAKPLTDYFEFKTGMKLNKHIQFSTPWPEMKVLEKGKVSKFNTTLFVNHNWNPVTVAWKSKSGKIYETHDTDIDCHDIEFWFEGLDVPLIHKQMYPKVGLPFKLNNLSYELVLTRFNMDCTIEFAFSQSHKKEVKLIAEEMSDFIGKYNVKSEKAKTYRGVIHNFKWNYRDEKLIFELDMGSAGFHFFKQFLPFVSQMSCFRRVEIC